MLIFCIFLAKISLASRILERKTRSIDVGSVIIENDTYELIKVNIESNLQIMELGKGIFGIQSYKSSKIL